MLSEYWKMDTCQKKWFFCYVFRVSFWEEYLTMFHVDESFNGNHFVASFLFLLWLILIVLEPLFPLIFFFFIGWDPIK